MPKGSLRERDVVELVIGDGSVDWLRILKREPFVLPKSYNSVSASSTSSLQNESDLNPPKSELLEVTGMGVRGGYGPDNDVQAEVFLPRSTRKYGTSRNATGGFITSQDSPWANPMAQNLFIVYERFPAVQFTNNHYQSITPELRWEGIRYLVEGLSDEEIDRIETSHEDGNGLRPIPFTTVTIGGFRS